MKLRNKLAIGAALAVALVSLTFTKPAKALKDAGIAYLNRIVMNGTIQMNNTTGSYSTTLTHTTATANRTITFPNATGTVALLGGSTFTSPLVIGGMSLSAPTSTSSLSLPYVTGDRIMVSELVTNAPDIASSVWGVSNGIDFEGGTLNTYETFLTVVDPTADRTLTMPDDSGTLIFSTLATNKTDAANSVWMGTNGIYFEGGTANNFEAFLNVTDPTADRTLSLPDLSGTLISQTGGAMILNGMTLSAPTTTGSIRLPLVTSYSAMVSSLLTNAPDIANSVIGVSDGLSFEGGTANDFEIFLSLVDPTADRTIRLPDLDGTILVQNAGTMLLNGVSIYAPASIHTATFPDATGTVMLQASNAMTLGGLTLTAPATVSTALIRAGTSQKILTELNGATLLNGATINAPTTATTVRIPQATGTMLVGGNVQVIAADAETCTTACTSVNLCEFGITTGTVSLKDCSTSMTGSCLCVLTQ